MLQIREVQHSLYGRVEKLMLWARMNCMRYDSGSGWNMDVQQIFSKSNFEINPNPHGLKTILSLPPYFVCESYRYSVFQFAYVCFFDRYFPLKPLKPLEYEVQSHCGVIFAQRCQWHCCACHSGVNDTAVHITAVSMTPLCMSKWCQWYHYVVCSRIIFLHKKQ
jgi:hypothetical protein